MNGGDRKAQLQVACSVFPHKFAIFTALMLLAMPLLNSAEKNELSVVPGDAPHSVRIAGPKGLTDLGRRQYGKWVGCGYSVQWGDGSVSPAGPAGADCAIGLWHTYKDAGTYRVVAKTFHLAPNDSPIYDWTGETRAVVK